MRIYPDLPRARMRTIAGDILVVALLVLFAWTGMKVHDTVIGLNSLSRGVQDAGSAVQGGFSDAAGAVQGVPLVGGPLSDSLKQTGGATGGNVVKAGRAGETAVTDTANALGWLTFALPALVLLAFVVPSRLRQMRRLRDASSLLGGAMTPARQRLLAMRAAFGLPLADLKTYTRDPIGDLEADRLDPLLAALFASSGLRPPPAAHA